MKKPDGQLVSHPGNPIPDGAQPGLCETPDGRLLRFALWDPVSGSKKGTVCIFPGRGEFIEKYFETVKDLQERGYGVAVLDWRGQGGSGYAKRKFFGAYISSFDEYEEDLITFMQHVVLPDCAPPYNAIAHSTGALVLVESLLRRTWFDKVILTAPLFALASRNIPWRFVHFSTGFLTALGLGSFYLPGRGARSFAGTSFFNNAFTGDEQRFNRVKDVIRAAPHLTSKRPKIGWLFAAFRAMSEMNSIPGKIELCSPVMIVSSRRDKVVSRDSAELFAQRVENATNIVIEGARHEILLERNDVREQFWAAFDSFFDGIQPIKGKAAQEKKTSRAA